MPKSYTTKINILKTKVFFTTLNSIFFVSIASGMQPSNFETKSKAFKQIIEEKSKENNSNISDLTFYNSKNNLSSSFKYGKCNVQFELTESSRMVNIKGSNVKERVDCSNKFANYFPEIIPSEILSQVKSNKKVLKFQTEKSSGQIKKEKGIFSFILYECNDKTPNCPTELLQETREINNQEINNTPMYE